MIVDMARGHVRLDVRGRTVTVGGEAYLPGYGPPDFVAYRNSIRHWDPPHDHSAVSDAETDEILRMLKSDLANRGMTLEVE